MSRLERGQELSEYLMEREKTCLDCRHLEYSETWGFRYDYVCMHPKKRMSQIPDQEFLEKPEWCPLERRQK